MSDFVLQQLEVKQSPSEFKESVKKYAEFLKQPVKLSMFVPCDENEKPLKIPHLAMFVDTGEALTSLNKAESEYNKALSKVIFKGFKLDKLYKNELYLSNNEIIVFLNSDFTLKHQSIEELAVLNLDVSLSF